MRRIIPSVHQYSPVIHDRDAIGNNIVALKNMFRSLGFESELFHGTEGDPAVSSPIESYTEKNGDESCLVIHYSLDDPKLDLLKTLPGKKILVYHNITPAHYFDEEWQPVAEACRRGRERMKEFPEWIDCSVGITQYNRLELEAVGLKNIFNIPLLIDFNQLQAPPDPKTLEDLKQNGTVNWLFVGRVTPHKKQDDLIRVFHYYQKYINPNSRLSIVGGYGGMPWFGKYMEFLLNRTDASKVAFTGLVSQEELMAYYRSADLFLCMSEHEGLCVPLVEAMHFNVPIIAYDAAAVGETLAGGGILVREKRYAEIAELAHYLISHQDLKESLARAQKKRLQDFSHDRIRDGWKQVFDHIETL